MQTELARLKSSLETSTNPKRVAELSAQFKALNTQLELAKKNAFALKPAMDQSAKSTQSVASQFGGLVSAVKTFIGFQIARKVGEIAVEAAVLSGNVEGVQRAFARAIPNAVQHLNGLREATHGTIGDLVLMQRTLQAKNLGIPVQELAGLFEFATIRAQQTGQSVDSLVDDIVNGLGRKSTRVIDNLGISASRIKDEFKGVSLETLSVAEVTKGVGNIIREEMQKMGDYVDTSATKVSMLTTGWEKLRQEVAKRITGDGGFIDFLNTVVDYYGRLYEAKNKDLTITELNNQKRLESLALISDESFAIHALTGSREENIKTIEKEIERLTSELGAYAKERQTAVDRINILRDEFEARKKINGDSYLARVEFEKQLKVQEKLRDAKKEDISLDQEILKLLQGRLAAMKQVDDQEVVSTGIIERKQAEIERLEEAIKKTNDPADLGRWGKLTMALEIARAELGDLQRAFSEGIDPKKLDMDLKTAEHSLTNFGTSIKRMEDQLAELANMAPVPPPETVAKLDSIWSELGKTWKENWRELTSASVDWQANVINSAIDVQRQNLQAELSMLKDHYQQRQALAGDNARAQSELRIKEEREVAKVQRRMFEKDKELRRSQVVVDGAAGVVKAFATAPFYLALAQSLVIAATVTAQLRNINKEQPRFAEGVIDLKGPGSTTSDSIRAMLSKGESVMTAKETRSSMGILKAIRNNELDDQILKRLHVTNNGVVMKDNSKDLHEIRDAIKATPQTDVVRQANTLYEAKTHGDRLYRKYRRKSMG